MLLNLLELWLMRYLILYSKNRNLFFLSYLLQTLLQQNSAKSTVINCLRGSLDSCFILLAIAYNINIIGLKNCSDVWSKWTMKKYVLKSTSDKKTTYKMLISWPFWNIALNIFKIKCLWISIMNSKIEKPLL